jgi:hypothetical protein
MGGRSTPSPSFRKVPAENWRTVRTQDESSAWHARRLFEEWLRVMFTPLNEHAGHRFAASAVVVDETTGGTFDFPGSNRNRSGSGVCCGLVAAFDRKAGAACRAQEPEVPAGFSHGAHVQRSGVCVRFRMV